MSTLHPSDRKHARRWLKEVGGEGRLRRIAAAFSKAPAAAHRPQGAPLDLLDRALAHAACLYVTTPNLQLGHAAGQTREHFAEEIATGNTTSAHFRRKLSDMLKAMPEEFYRNVADGLAASGQPLRPDLYSDLAAVVQTRKRSEALYRTMGAPALRPSAFATGLTLPKATADGYARQFDAAVRARELVDFATLFNLPDHLPISMVAAWFDVVREHLAREQDVPSG